MWLVIRCQDWYFDWSLINQYCCIIEDFLIVAIYLPIFVVVPIVFFCWWWLSFDVLYFLQWSTQFLVMPPFFYNYDILRFLQSPLCILLGAPVRCTTLSASVVFVFSILTVRFSSEIFRDWIYQTISVCIALHSVMCLFAIIRAIWFVQPVIHVLVYQVRNCLNGHVVLLYFLL